MIETFSQNLAEENTLKHDILKVKDFFKKIQNFKFQSIKDLINGLRHM